MCKGFTMKKIVWVLIVISVIVGGVLLYHLHLSREEDICSPNYEAIAKLERVVDGDTVVVDIKEIVDPHRGVELGEDKVRLAGVDTEETSQKEAARKRDKLASMSQSEYEDTVYYQRAIEAKKLLKSVLSNRGNLFLDIDDLARGKCSYRGYYGRLIAVIYVRDNNGWLNMNAHLVNEEYSGSRSSQYPICTKFSSEFDPYLWLEDDYRFV